MPDSTKFVPVVAVLNMKGGVGKTTISAHVFRALYQIKRIGTLLVDLDPQFNLTQQLFTRVQYDALKAAGQTIAKVMEKPSNVGLFDINTASVTPPDVSAVAKDLFYFNDAKDVKLSIVPGDFALVKYSLMDDNAKLGAVRKRFLTFVDNSKKSYGVVCIDCNPSSSFLTLCALKACTHVLVPVRPDRYSILGLEILAEFIESVPEINPKPQIVVAINGVPRSNPGPEIDAIETELRGHAIFGARTLSRSLRTSGYLSAKPDYTGFAMDQRGPWSDTIKSELRATALELATKLGI